MLRSPASSGVGSPSKPPLLKFEDLTPESARDRAPPGPSLATQQVDDSMVSLVQYLCSNCSPGISFTSRYLFVSSWSYACTSPPPTHTRGTVPVCSLPDSTVVPPIYVGMVVYHNTIECLSVSFLCKSKPANEPPVRAIEACSVRCMYIEE